MKITLGPKKIISSEILNTPLERYCILYAYRAYENIPLENLISRQEK